MLISLIVSIVIVGVLAWFIGPSNEELKEILQDCEELQKMLDSHIEILNSQETILKHEREYLQSIPNNRTNK